jgi:hypothetical protein
VDGRGGTWNIHGTILFARSIDSAIYSLPEDGGTPAPITKIDPALYTSHRWRRFLANTKTFLYWANWASAMNTATFAFRLIASSHLRDCTREYASSRNRKPFGRKRGYDRGPFPLAEYRRRSVCKH